MSRDNIPPLNTAEKEELAAGRELRDDALDRHERSTGPFQLTAIVGALIVVLATGTVCANDVWRIAGVPADPKRRACIGSVFRSLSAMGLLKKSAARTAAIRKESHARDMPIWEPVDRAAVSALLAVIKALLIEHVPDPDSPSDASPFTPAATAPDPIGPTSQRSLFGEESAEGPTND